MRTIRHWTPRYAFNRGAWYVYERRNGDKPWLTPQANELLDSLILPTDIGLEWGSGRSTAWLSRHLKHLTSVEDNTDWYKRVEAQLASGRLSNVDYRLTAPPGDQETGLSDYVQVASSFADESLGFALVDGSAREYCAEAVVSKIVPGGLLVIDDTNGFFEHHTHSPVSRLGKGPLNATWARVAVALSNWRMIWTSSGLKDTSIYIRPSAQAATRAP